MTFQLPIGMHSGAECLQLSFAPLLGYIRTSVIWLLQVSGIVQVPISTYPYLSAVHSSSPLINLQHHRFPPFFFAATTRKLPFDSSAFSGAFAGPFFATSLQPPVLSAAAECGLALLGGAVGSTSPLSASFLRRMNSSAKWRESIVLLAPCTASVIMSASGGKKTSEETNSSAM